MVTKTSKMPATPKEGARDFSYVKKMDLAIMFIGPALIATGVALNVELVADIVNAITTAFWTHGVQQFSHVWQKYLDKWGQGWFYTIGTFFSSIVVFWAYCGFLSLVDLLGWPHFLLRFKVQSTETDPRLDDPEFVAKYKEGVLTVLFNMVFVNGPTMWIGYYILVARGNSFSSDFPMLYEMGFDFLVFLIIEELGFYYGHRLMHTRNFYGRFHKKHHLWQAPVGFVSYYAHPVEHFLVNLVPVMAGPMLMKSHVLSLWLWIIIATSNSINSHSGYHFPFMASPHEHDFHHMRFDNCFGVLGICDWLHGTDRKFAEYQKKEGHDGSWLWRKAGWPLPLWCSYQTLLVMVPVLSFAQYISIYSPLAHWQQ